MKSQLDQILVEYLKENNSHYLTLEKIPTFKKVFCEYLLEGLHVTENNLEESFGRWCRQLGSGRAFLEVRRVAVYVLWFHCKLKQYHIAKLLNMSTRQIRRDMREIEKQMRAVY